MDGVEDTLEGVWRSGRGGVERAGETDGESKLVYSGRGGGEFWRLVG